MHTRRTLLAIALLVPGTLTLLARAGVQEAAAPIASSPFAGKTVVVTGANRGLGLEFAAQFAAAGARVIGTARKPKDASELAATGAKVMALDVSDEASVAAFAEALDGAPVHLLINNAGVSGRAWSEGASYAELTRRVLEVNTLGPIRVTEALLPNLVAAKGATIVNVSSRLGSLEHNTSGGFRGYRESKAALNMYSRSLAADHRDKQILAICVSPGWVRTDMGGPEATLSTEESIGGLRRVIEELKPEQSGLFLNHDGSLLEW